ncbi:phage head closure protein [Parabacteroides sp.]
MISAGLLKERITFLQAETMQNDFGEQVQTWKPVYCCRADVKFSKGSRAILAGEVWNPTSVVITCRLNCRINARQRIKWAENSYTIASINPDSSDRSLTIIADLINENNGR